MKATLILLAFALSATLCAPPTRAQEPTVLRQCGLDPIRLPGSYVLGGNLNATGDCLVVEASFVTIDLGGFSIAGDGTGTAINAGRRINGRVQGTVVRNGSITNFATAIALGSFGLVEEVRIFNNNSGIISFDDDPGNTVRNSTFHGNRFAAINLTGFSNIVVGNIAIENGNGIFAESGSLVSNNLAVNNDEEGIGTIFGSTVINNIAQANTDGIVADCPVNIVENTALFNTNDLVLFDNQRCRDINNLFETQVNRP